MMRKKIVSLCMALVLCLGLLPTTALAAETNTVYVGGVALTGSSENIVYATTNESGEVTTEGATTDNYNIKWDGSTLTLRGATIKNELYADQDPLIYITGAAIGVFNQSGDANLTITLEGTNTIKDVSYGICVLAPSNGSAKLTITGSGSLDVSATSTGIRIQSHSGDAAVSIKNAKVTATAQWASGVNVRCGTNSSASLTVNGGNLTSSGKPGILYDTLESSILSTIKFIVSNSALVDARGGGIGAGSLLDLKEVSPADDSVGIVFGHDRSDSKAGTVYGDVTLQEDLTIGEGESLDIPSGASLTIDSGATLTNEGTVTTTGNGTLTNNGKIENSGTLPDNIQGTAPPSITTTALDDGTVNTSYSETLNADGSPTSWEVTDGSLPAGLTLDESTGVISGTPTADGTFNFTVKATNDGGSDSKELSITIGEQTNVPVNRVLLNKTSTTLTVGNTETLTATVEPANATNKAVTWSSDNSGVATVSNGVVTAVAPGTATITVTTADGGFTATCTVTVRPDIPPANPNYRITVEATQGGTVTADPTAAKAGATVTLTPVPDRGYQVGTVTVTDRFGDTVEVTENADGTYTFTMPNGQVTVTVTFEQAPLPFPDVTEGDWFYDAVRYAYETGLMDGVGDNLFAPNSQTTRAQLVTILYRLEGEPEVSGTSGFSDVAAGTWYTDAVAWAAQNGIVNGVSDTEFAPGDDITREQLAAILYRYAAYQGYDVSQRADLSGFGDAESISGYAQEALSWAHAQGLVLGFEDGSLRPQGTASRAQIAAVLMRFLAAVPTE